MPKELGYMLNNTELIIESIQSKIFRIKYLLVIV